MKNIKIIFLLFGLSTIMYADFMDSIGDIVKSTLSDDEDEKIPEIKTVGTVETLIETQTKERDEDDSLLDSMVDTVKDTVGIKKEKYKDSSFVSKTITAMKEVVGLEKIKEDNSFFDGGIMGDMADMIDLEKGESFGLPSVFGLNKKKKIKVFGSTVLGDTLLGDAKDMSTGVYRGFKRTGESTEFMSGMMYKSSRMYNEMFDMFDDSPLNIFDNKDEREPSVFDVFDKGNDMLDIFD